jgi:hypothetical protein
MNPPNPPLPASRGSLTAAAAAGYTPVAPRYRRRHGEGRLFIAIDLEYLADASTNTTFRPNTTEEWYAYLQQYVNNGTVAQISLAIASEERSLCTSSV